MDLGILLGENIFFGFSSISFSPITSYVSSKAIYFFDSVMNPWIVSLLLRGKPTIITITGLIKKLSRAKQMPALVKKVDNTELK